MKKLTTELQGEGDLLLRIDENFDNSEIVYIISAIAKSCNIPFELLSKFFTDPEIKKAMADSEIEVWSSESDLLQ